jgi:hypothetical protein
VRAKEVEAAKAEADYRRLVATGKAKLEFGIAEGDLWTYFCMARLCAGTAPPRPPIISHAACGGVINPIGRMIAACEAEECREWMTKCASKRYLSKVRERETHTTHDTRTGSQTTRLHLYKHRQRSRSWPTLRS